VIFVITFAENKDSAKIIADLDKTKGEQLGKNLLEAGCNVKFIQVDVTAWESAINMFRQAIQALTQVSRPSERL
jgi:hypothetical protein